MTADNQALGEFAAVAAPDAMEPAPAESRWRGLARQFAEDRVALVALLLLLLIVAATLLAPWIAPQNPYDIAKLDVLDAKLPPGSAASSGTMTYWLGSDAQGRDMLSAVLYGLRISLLVGVVSVSCALTLGTVLGLAAAYFRGWFDVVIMRIVDIQLALPAVLIALVLLSVLGKGVDKVIVALIAVQWAYFARTARAAAIVERSKEYMDAATCLALGPMRRLLRHLLPNCMPPLTALAAIDFAESIAAEAALSFLGVGVPITEPSLGMLTANGFDYLMSGRYWISFFPGVALTLVVLTINVVSDRIGEVLNPRGAR